MGKNPPTKDRLRQLAEEFVRRRKAGEALDAKAFCAQHADEASALGPLLAGILARPNEPFARAFDLAFGSEAAQTMADPSKAGAAVSSATDAAAGTKPAGSEDVTRATTGAGADTATRGPDGSSEPVERFDDRYRIVKTLGAGGFGKVLLVEDELYRDKKLALKVILPKHSEAPEFEQRFRNEIEILRRLQHEAIPQIYNDGRTKDGEFYYTMAFVEGPTLESILRAQAPLKPDRIVRIVRQVLAVLDYAHAHNVVHRDLKPSNIMIVKADTEDEQVKVLDFGIAKVLQQEGAAGEALTMHTSAPIGTPDYMSPEQARNSGDVDGKTDVYALGVIIYRMVTAELPFTGNTPMEKLVARLEHDATSLHGRTTPLLETLVSRLLARDRATRPTATKVLNEFGPPPNPWLIQLAVTLGMVVLLAGGYFGWNEWKRLHSIVPPNPPPIDLPLLQATIETPSDGTFTKASSIDLSGWVTNWNEAGSPSSLLVNGVSSSIANDGNFRSTVSLPAADGETVIRVLDGGRATEKPVAEVRVIVDRTRPTLTFTKPLPGTEIPETGIRLLQQSSLTISGRVADAVPGRFDRLLLGTETIAVASDGTFSVTRNDVAASGTALSFKAVDAAGNETIDELHFATDSIAPTIEIDRPRTTERTTHDEHLLVSGRVVDDHPDQLLLNDVAIDVDRSGAFSKVVPLQPEGNLLRLVATDKAGNRSIETKIEIKRLLTLAFVKLEPADGWTAAADQTQVEVKGEANLPLARAEIGGHDAVVEDGTKFRSIVKLVEGKNPVEVTVTDRDDQRVTQTITIQRPTSSLPAGFKAAPGSKLLPSGLQSALVHEGSKLELVLVEPGTYSLPDQRNVSIDHAFYIGRYEVTNRQFEQFVNDMKVVLDPPWEYHPGDEERPATQLPFDQAEAFCKWLSQSARGVFRLPSTSEWQWAACGPKSFKYPWGDEWRVGASNSNNDRNSSAKVGSFPVDLSWCGAQDMAGNVTEWCSADSKDRKAAIRGGSWTSPPASSIVFDEKPAVPTGRPEFVGFRVVLEVTP